MRVGITRGSVSEPLFNLSNLWLAIAALVIVGAVACSSSSLPSPPPVTVETYTGTGMEGGNDGQRAEATFDGPEGIAVAADGTVYVAETLKGRVRRISPGGEVTTILDGEAVKLPHRLAVGLIGELYVTDAGNNRILVVSPSGEVETFAGTGESGDADGPRLEAAFNFPIGIAVGPNGTVYVADSGNSKVRAVRPDGMVVTLAGTGERGYRDGPGAGALFSGLNELAVDPDGNVFVTETANSLVRRITPDGTVSTVAGRQTHGFRDGDPDEAEFDGLGGIAVGRDGTIFVAEFGNDRVRQITPGESVLTLAGDTDSRRIDGSGKEARLNRPTSLAIGPNGELYVADTRNNLIRLIRFE